jgi:hypothetical protein
MEVYFMARKLAGYSITAITVAALLLTLSSTVVFAEVVASATGSGHIEVSGTLRTFTFNANTDSSGVTKGQTQGENRNAGIKWHGTLTCLNVVGNVATMSGVVTDITPGLGDPFLVGNFIQFQVTDNGQGQNAPPDLISLTLFFPQGTTDPGCTVPQITATIPILHGNVTVH